MCGFCAVQDQEDQSSSPDCLLMDDVSAGILIDIDGLHIFILIWDVVKEGV